MMGKKMVDSEGRKTWFNLKSMIRTRTIGTETNQRHNWKLLSYYEKYLSMHTDKTHDVLGKILKIDLDAFWAHLWVKRIKTRIFQELRLKK